MARLDHSSHEPIAAAVVACTRYAEDQASQHTSMETREDHERTPLTEELLIIDSF